MSHNLLVDHTKLTGADEALLSSLMTYLDSQKADAKARFNALKGIPAFKEALTLQKIGSERSGIGAKIVEWLKNAETQAALRVASSEVQSLRKELNEAATIDNLNFSDPKYRARPIRDEATGAITDIQIRIPASEFGMAASFWDKLKTASDSLDVEILALAKAAKVVAETAKSISAGKFDTDVTGQWIFRMPERKAATPKDPNAPKGPRTTNSKSAIYKLVYGEALGKAQVVSDSVHYKDLVFEAAKYARANGITKGGSKNLPFTESEATPGKSYNIPTVYTPILKKAGFNWTVVAPEVKPEV